MRWPADIVNAPLRSAIALLLVQLGIAAPADATIYKCSGENGAPVYQDSACPPGRELRDFDKDPPTVSVMPLGPALGISTGKSTAPAAGKAAPPAKESVKVKKDAPSTNAGDRKFLAPGLGEGDVVTRIGQPDMKSGSGRKTSRWTYLPAHDDPHTLTTLTFENGRLVEVERKVVK